MYRVYIGSIFLLAFILVPITNVRLVLAQAKIINGCANSTNGQIRLLDPVSKSSGCRVGEVPVSWNKEGLRGDQGPQGDPGPQGIGVGVFKDSVDILDCNGPGTTGKRFKIFRDRNNNGIFDPAALPPALPDTIISSFNVCEGAVGAQGPQGPQGPPGPLGSWMPHVIRSCNGNSRCTTFYSCPNPNDVPISCSCGSTIAPSSIQVVYVGDSPGSNRCICSVKNTSSESVDFRRGAHCVDSTP